MIRLLTAILILASAAVRADTQVPHTFEDGEVISAAEFNQNFDALESAIDGVPAGATGPQGPAGAAGVAAGLTCNTNQVIRWNGTAWACADDVLATLNCDVGDRLVRGDNGWECSNSYSVSGNLTGMDSGNSVGLTLNGESLTMSANGLFTFPNEVEAGQSYTVQIQAQPPNGTETCEVTANGSGNVLAPITDVAVLCYPIAEAYVASFNEMDWGMANMFDTLSPNLDTGQLCDEVYCVFELSNVTDHSNCDISWSGAAATNANPSVDKTVSRVRIDPMFAFQNDQPLTISLSCPSQ